MTDVRSSNAAPVSQPAIIPASQEALTGRELRKLKRQLTASGRALCATELAGRGIRELTLAQATALFGASIGYVNACQHLSSADRAAVAAGQSVSKFW
jgi:hypothetical protein